MSLHWLFTVTLTSRPPFFRGRKRRAPRAIKEIKKFVEKEMGTPEVRIDTLLNKFVWSKGIWWVQAA